MPKKEKDTEANDSKLEFNEKMTLNAKLFRLLILVVCFGFISAIYMIFQPQDLSDIDGYKSASTSPRNIQEVLTKAVEGNYSVTLTEADINQMFQNELVTKQGGMLSSDASIKRVLVRLKENLAEVIIQRDVFGQELTISMYIQIQQTEDRDGITTKVHLHDGDIEKKSILPNVGGRFGKLRVPQGFLKAVVPDYVKLANALSTEIDLGFDKMARFKIEEDRVTLDPRKPTRHEGGEGSSF